MTNNQERPEVIISKDGKLECPICEGGGGFALRYNTALDCQILETKQGENETIIAKVGRGFGLVDLPIDLPEYHDERIICNNCGTGLAIPWGLLTIEPV
jgi:hypothetical protein